MDAMFYTVLNRNAECCSTVLKSTKETGTGNERRRTKRAGLEYMFSLSTKEIQSMSTRRFQTENLHFKANGNWLMYSLWRLVTWPICAEVYSQIQAKYYKSIIMQTEWAGVCSAHAMTSNMTEGQAWSICACSLYELKISLKIAQWCR